MTIRTDAVPLDRLSALLEGALPSIDILGDDCPWPAAEGRLHVHLLTRGEADYRDADGHTRLQAPALVVAAGQGGYRVAPAADAGSLRLLVSFAGPGGPLLAEQFSVPLAIACVGEDAGGLAQIVTLICGEARASRCGHPALLRRAGEILFITLLRYLIERPEHSGELFRGLAEPRLARALVAMHERPAAPWTLEGLADTAGMSRTAFANTFRDRLRQTPGHYLGTLRLALARRAVDEGRGLKEAARRSGYTSTAALSRALARAGARSPITQYPATCRNLS